MMNKVQMGEIMSMVSALDGQIFSEAKVAMWLEVLGSCTYEELKTAIAPAHLEADKGIVQARDLFEQVRRARDGQQKPTYKADEADLNDKGWRSDPQPVCRDHDLPITSCDSCCDVLAEMSFWSADDRHNWAVRNLYRADSLTVA